MSVNIQIWSPTAEYICTHPQWNELMSPENCVTLSTSKILHTGPAWLPLKWGGARDLSLVLGPFKHWVLSPRRQQRGFQTSSTASTDPGNAKRCLPGSPQAALRRLHLTGRINPHFTKERVWQMILQTSCFRTEDVTRCSLQDGCLGNFRVW